MKVKSTIKVYNNSKLILNQKDIICIYKPQEYLIFNDKYGQHKINIIKKIYTKETKDNIMSIDFINNHCNIKLLDIASETSFDIESSFIYKEKTIEIIYIFDKEEIKIEILMKE